MVKELFSRQRTPYRFSLAKSDKGFTALELLISISIFTLMTTLILIQSKQFEQGIILTNVAREVAVHIRTAQNYSLNVRKAGDSFDVGYGVHFSKASGENTKVILFALPKSSLIQTDVDVYSENAIAGSEILYTIKNTIYIEELCAGSTEISCFSKNSLDIFFYRPNLDAVICAEGPCGLSPYAYARITLSLPDGNKRYVTVTKTGLVSVKDTP